MNAFVPFVLHLGEHLDGYGKVCRCREVKPPAEPSAPQQEAKITRVATWEDDEIREAQRRGVKVWVASKDWGKE